MNNPTTKIKTHRVTIWNMAARNIRRRPQRSFLSASAIGIAAMTMVLLLSMLAGMRLDMAQQIKRYTTGDIIIQAIGANRPGQPAGQTYVTNLQAIRDQVQAVPAVAKTSPRLTGMASVWIDGEMAIFPLTGLDFSSDPMNLSDFLPAGAQIPASGSRETLVTTALATRLGLSQGQKFEIIIQTARGSSNGMTLTISGIINPANDHFSTAQIFVDFATAARLVKLQDAADSLLVNLKPKSPLSDSLTQIQAAVPGVEVQLWSQNSLTYGFMEMAGIMYNFMGVFFFCLASTVIINTMLMVVLERSREIGTLAALGMERTTIRRLFLAESAILSAIGAACGTLAGLVLGLVLNHYGLDFSAAMQGMQFNINPVLRPVVEPWALLVVFVTATLVSTLFTLLPVRRINSLKIVDAIRS